MKAEADCHLGVCARKCVRQHFGVATFRQNVSELARGLALWQGTATTHFAPREVSIGSSDGCGDFEMPDGIGIYGGMVPIRPEPGIQKALGALSTLGFGVEPGPPGRAKLLLSREPGDTPTRVSGSAGASPSRGWRIPKSRLDGALG